MEFETVIGLEVHAQLNTKSKIFCGCSTVFGRPANSQTCPVCLGLPGALPVFNREVLSKSIMAGLALECDIQLFNKFDRKNYFYPDLPKAYQISQYDEPICIGGGIDIQTANGPKRIELTRIHMEEDAGKLVHATEKPVSYVNLNRAGTPLIEIVTEPQMRNADEAYEFLGNLKNILEYIEVSDCNMEEGSLRCDANVSIRPVGQKEFGTRVEIKNLNSFKAVRAAINYEVERHRGIIMEGGAIKQSTRLWDPDRGVTNHMRYKEDEMDYRYFPEPDLPPIQLEQAVVDEIQATLPELPKAKQARYVKELGIGDYDAEVLASNRRVAAYFESALDSFIKLGGKETKKVVNWMSTEVMGSLNSENITITEFSTKVSAQGLGELVHKITSDEITGKIAKKVFDEMIKTGDQPGAIIERNGYKQVSDTGELEGIISKLIEENPESAQEFKQGKTKVIGFFVGQVMKATRGQANPKVVNELLTKKLRE